MEISQFPFSLITFLTTILLSLYVMYRNQKLYGRLMLIPYMVEQKKEWYRFVTSGFIHADLMHLGFNMLTFYFFAFRYEAMTGGLQFLIIYFGSMVLADVMTYLRNKSNPDYAALGASGAIAGLLFSYILYDPEMSLYIMFIPIPIPAPIFAILYLVYCWYADKKSMDNINHNAHLWGAISGLALTAILDISSFVGFFQYVF